MGSWFDLFGASSGSPNQAMNCATNAKYSDCSCTEPRQQPLEGNTQETVRDAVIQEIDLEDVDAEIQRELICLTPL